MAASERASSASQLSTRVSSRYASRRATANEHAGRPASCYCQARLAAKALIEAVTRFSAPTVLGCRSARLLHVDFFHVDCALTLKRVLWVPETPHTSRDLLILVEQSTEPVAPSDGVRLARRLLGEWS